MVAIDASKVECWAVLKNIIEAASPGLVANPAQNTSWEETHRRLFDSALAEAFKLSLKVQSPMSCDHAIDLLTDVLVNGILTPETLEIDFLNGEWTADISENDAWLLLLAAFSESGIFSTP